MSESRGQILDGTKTAAEMAKVTAELVRDIREQSGVVPCLTTVLVGDDPASVTYTQMKRKRCEAVGMTSRKVELPAETTTEGLVDEIQKLADDTSVHGILLQHPSPSHIDERLAFETIPSVKDVDGVTFGSFATMSFSEPGWHAATPGGIVRLLEAYDISVEGLHAVVVGRSAILGKPIAALLLERNATVTICHSRTQNLAEHVKRADLVVAAVGKPRFVQGDWIKDGAIVIDAGYNPGNVGDIDLDAAMRRASWYTPVPGGVGPMTIATLIRQTALAAAKQLNLTVGERALKSDFWDQRYANAQYAYGTTPNGFLEAQASKLETGKTLCLAEGEGRNAAFLAERGHAVLAVDFSREGLRKARALAESRGTRIDTLLQDLGEWEPEPASWQTVVAIFSHLPSKSRLKMLENTVRALAPGGVLLLEAYEKGQLGRGTGGPPKADMLYDLDETRQALSGLDFEIAHVTEREIVEGEFHTGMARVVQILAKKPS